MIDPLYVPYVFAFLSFLISAAVLGSAYLADEL